MPALQRDEDVSAAQKATVTTWTAQNRGLRKLPLRIALSGADSHRLLWWVAFAAIPVALLAFAVSVGDKAWYVYSLYCGLMMLLISGRAERFINITAELDRAAGEVSAIYHMGEPTLFRSDKCATGPFESVESSESVPR